MSRQCPTRPARTAAWRRSLLAVAVVAIAAWSAACARSRAGFEAPPARLADTGLYVDFAARSVRAGVLPYTPQYPLWTDGAHKQRWVELPHGTTIDSRNPDHWQFPVGTSFWKQFDFGRPVETRWMHRRRDGTWLYATYRWLEDGSDAVLVPESGQRSVCATGDGSMHDLPSVADCRLCHEGSRTPVLGFTAWQLSPDRDPLAPHAEPVRMGDVDLATLRARGLLRDAPTAWQHEAPRIDARSPHERAALGYLLGNCSNCHNDDGPLRRLGLRFDLPLATRGTPPAIATTLGVDSQFRRPGASLRIDPGAPEHSVLLRRLAATDALTQMPPFGRHLADRDAVALIEQWIAVDLAPTAPVTTVLPSAKRP